MPYFGRYLKEIGYPDYVLDTRVSRLKALRSLGIHSTPTQEEVMAEQHKPSPPKRVDSYEKLVSVHTYLYWVIWALIWRQLCFCTCSVSTQAVQAHTYVRCIGAYIHRLFRHTDYAGSQVYKSTGHRGVHLEKWARGGK